MRVRAFKGLTVPARRDHSSLDVRSGKLKPLPCLAVPNRPPAELPARCGADRPSHLANQPRARSSRANHSGTAAANDNQATPPQRELYLAVT
jgi:hypothetical protein